MGVFGLSVMLVNYDMMDLNSEFQNIISVCQSSDLKFQIFSLTF